MPSFFLAFFDETALHIYTLVQIAINALIYISHEIGWGKQLIFKMSLFIQEFWGNKSLKNLGKDVANTVFLNNPIYPTI
ncbi:hypothetical protein CGSSp9BS68_06510 [Streptococcus pneumoniae SP9-BS68]|nr:hypothetical protein CGSSp9BS68_06510 [Streptococcus pneumoniae SP9-BS68]